MRYRCPECKERGPFRVNGWASLSADAIVEVDSDGYILEGEIQDYEVNEFDYDDGCGAFCSKCEHNDDLRMFNVDNQDDEDEDQDEKQPVSELDSLMAEADRMITESSGD